MDKINCKKNQINIQINNKTDWQIEFYTFINEINLIYQTNILIVADEKVAKLFSSELNKFLAEKVSNNYSKKIIYIKASEKNKSFKTVEKIIKAADSIKMNGSGTIIAIGGGIILDIAGFAASIYRRGVNYIRVPTTLLAQIDAAVGIKNGLNYANLYKNFLGTFYPAKRVIICREFLKTLKQQEISCGVAEILKLAIIADKELFCMTSDKHHKLLKLTNTGTINF